MSVQLEALDILGDLLSRFGGKEKTSLSLNPNYLRIMSSKDSKTQEIKIQ